MSGATLAAGSASVTLPDPLPAVLDASGPVLSLRVVADPVDNPAASGSRSLGVEDPDNFHAITAGTSLDFSFSDPVLAFGLTIVTPEEPDLALFDGDLLLSVPGESTAALQLTDGEALGVFGAREYRTYFLGVVAGTPFSTARLEPGGATPTSTYLFNVADLRIAAPEPAGAVVWLAGAVRLRLLLQPKRVTTRRPGREGRPR